MRFGRVVLCLRLRHCPAGRRGSGRTGGSALGAMRSFSRLLRTSRRQLCSSRHNVEGGVARCQACVGDRGFRKGGGSVDNDVDMSC